MDLKNRLPFPQADDFYKVIRLLNIDDSSLLKNNHNLSVCLDSISLRQVGYYLSACKYLNLINKDNEYTELGLYLRPLSQSNQLIELIRILLADRIIGTIYISEKFLKVPFNKSDIVDILNRYNIGAASVTARRAQTAKNWIRWIEQYI